MENKVSAYKLIEREWNDIFETVLSFINILYVRGEKMALNKVKKYLNTLTGF